MTGRLIAYVFAGLLALAMVSPGPAEAQSATAPADKSVNNLMLVVREALGQNKLDEKLVPVGKVQGVVRSTGQVSEVETAAFRFIGDLHIRLVFDAPTVMENAKPEDLPRLKLTPEQAVERGIANLERVYGPPVAQKWTAGMFVVRGKSDELNSSYMLDRAFWREQLKKYPKGLVVSVPARNMLVFVPANSKKAVTQIGNNIPALYYPAGQMHVSSALYLFKDDKWSVFKEALEK